MEEQRAKCDEAAELKRRGNEFYQKGELVEAAKLYEQVGAAAGPTHDSAPHTLRRARQAVMKFADWYAVAFATDEEKAMVHAVKLPCHNNLATCSFKLGNHQHASVHSTQVLDHEPDNVKALYRRGACELRLGNLEQARTDLQRASKLAPADAEVRAELTRLREKLAEYKQEKKQMSNRMLAGADGGQVDEPGTSAAADDAEPPQGSEAAEQAAQGAAHDLGPPQDEEVPQDEAQAQAAAFGAFGGGSSPPNLSADAEVLHQKLLELEEQLKATQAEKAAAVKRAGEVGRCGTRPAPARCARASSERIRRRAG